jgi:hypothetical protein
LIKDYSTPILLALVLVFFSIVIFAGCNQQSPLSSIKFDNTVNHATQKEIRFVQLDLQDHTFNKTISVNEWVTVEEGGKLELEYSGGNKNQVPVYCKNTLKVFEETISEDADLTLSIDSKDFFQGNFDVLFAPHGITFSSPALLTIEIKNADLTGFDPDDLELFYINQQTGQWEEIHCCEIIVDINTGYIKVINAEIAHFSRYAIGEEQ